MNWNEVNKYLKKKIKFAGFKIGIENNKGDVRKGKDDDGHEWESKMYYAYGFFYGTRGKDKDHLDVYLGPKENSETVFIVHQNDPVKHKYDEDKVMLGFKDQSSARKAYLKQYDRPGFLGSITDMPIEEFRSKIFSKEFKGSMIKSMDQKELGLGIKVEQEHSDTFGMIETYYKKHNKLPPEEMVYASIAADHLEEFKDYYSRLKEMERKAKGKKEEESGKVPSKKVMIEFLKKNPNPNDEQLHEFAEGNGYNVHKTEKVLYSIATEAVKMKKSGIYISKGTGEIFFKTRGLPVGAKSKDGKRKKIAQNKWVPIKGEGKGIKEKVEKKKKPSHSETQKLVKLKGRYEKAIEQNLQTANHPENDEATKKKYMQIARINKKHLKEINSRLEGVDTTGALEDRMGKPKSKEISQEQQGKVVKDIHDYMKKYEYNKITDKKKAGDFADEFMDSHLGLPTNPKSMKPKHKEMRKIIMYATMSLGEAAKSTGRVMVGAASGGGAKELGEEAKKTGSEISKKESFQDQIKNVVAAFGKKSSWKSGSSLTKNDKKGYVNVTLYWKPSGRGKQAASEESSFRFLSNENKLIRMTDFGEPDTGADSVKKVSGIDEAIKIIKKETNKDKKAHGPEGRGRSRSGVYSYD